MKTWERGRKGKAAYSGETTRRGNAGRSQNHGRVLVPGGQDDPLYGAHGPGEMFYGLPWVRLFRRRPKVFYFLL